MQKKFCHFVVLFNCFQHAKGFKVLYSNFLLNALDSNRYYKNLFTDRHTSTENTLEIFAILFFIYKNNFIRTSTLEFIQK